MKSKQPIAALEIHVDATCGQDFFEEHIIEVHGDFHSPAHNRQPTLMFACPAIQHDHCVFFCRRHAFIGASSQINHIA